MPESGALRQLVRSAEVRIRHRREQEQKASVCEVGAFGMRKQAFAFSQALAIGPGNVQICQDGPVKQEPMPQAARVRFGLRTLEVRDARSCSMFNGRGVAVGAHINTILNVPYRLQRRGSKWGSRLRRTPRRDF